VEKEIRGSALGVLQGTDPTIKLARVFRGASTTTPGMRRSAAGDPAENPFVGGQAGRVHLEGTRYADQDTSSMTIRWLRMSGMKTGRPMPWKSLRTGLARDRGPLRG